MTTEACKARLRRKAAIMTLGGFRPPSSPTASWFGNVMVGAPGESWPSFEGKPMMPLFQLNLSEAPFVPPNLADISLITCFVRQENLPTDGSANGGDWLLRAYKAADDLTLLEIPVLPSTIKPFPITFGVCEEDFPCWEDVPFELPEEIAENYHDNFENIHRSKLGGWPTLIQSEIFWAPWNRHPAKPEYAFQIASEDKAKWYLGDAGVGYFGRGTEMHSGTWTFAWQCR